MCIRDSRTVGLEALPNGFEAEQIEVGERGQVRGSEGSVRHVEVFQMGSVRTSIIGRPRHLPGHRHAGRYPAGHYTLDCEEPHNAGGQRLRDD